MKPDASTHDPSKEYFIDLVKSTGITREKLAIQLGMNDRTVRRYQSGERPVPYLVQFALESIVLEP